MTPEEFRADRDWSQAVLVSDFGKSEKYSKSNFADAITRVVAYSEGEGDGPNWLALVELEKGDFAFIDAGCDYTGWDCQAGGDVDFVTLEYFLGPLGTSPEIRKRLSKTLGESGLAFTLHPTTREGCLASLKSAQENGDIKVAHGDADEALLAFINDPEITEAYDKITKWYA